MIQIDKNLIRELYDKAVVNPRLRQNMDLRNSPDDGGQRLLYALMSGTVVPAGAWHTVEVLEPSVIFEEKDGKYGEDGSETI